MEVAVESIWASQSILHLRVLVWGDQKTWHRKYDVVFPIDELDEHVVEAIARRHQPTLEADLGTIPLF